MMEVGGEKELERNEQLLIDGFATRNYIRVVYTSLATCLLWVQARQDMPPVNVVHFIPVKITGEHSNT